MIYVAMETADGIWLYVNLNEISKIRVKVLVTVLCMCTPICTLYNFPRSLHFVAGQEEYESQCSDIQLFIASWCYLCAMFI